MLQSQWNTVDTYLTDRLLPPDPVLENALAAIAAAHLPPISVSPNQGKLLMMLARLMAARSILEIGTLGGYSTIWLARGLSPGGRVVSLEINHAYAAVARFNLARAGLDQMADVRVGPALDTLPAIFAAGEGPFDLIFIDADKASTPEYFQWSLRLARPGAAIVIDNTVRDGAVIDPDSSDPSVRGVRRCMDMLAAEPGVSASGLQVVGSKGYDGFVLAMVNERS